MRFCANIVADAGGRVRERSGRGLLVVGGDAGSGLSLIRAHPIYEKMESSGVRENESGAHALRDRVFPRSEDAALQECHLPCGEHGRGKRTSSLSFLGSSSRCTTNFNKRVKRSFSEGLWTLPKPTSPILWPCSISFSSLRHPCILLRNSGPLDL